METQKLLTYVKNFDDQFDLTLKIDDIVLDMTLKAKLTNPNRLPSERLEEIQKLKSVILTGGVRNQPGSVVLLGITANSLIGLVQTYSTTYKISLIDNGEKFIPGLFKLTKTKSNKIIKSNPQPDTDPLACDFISVDVGLEFDHLFLDHFSTFQEPLSEAQGFAEIALSIANQVWSDIDERFTIRLVRVVGPFTPDIPSFSDFSLWRQKVMEDWGDNHHCLRKDGIVFFTGHPIGVLGVTNPTTSFLCQQPTLEFGQRISIIGGIENNWDLIDAGWTVAHELGHQIGLDYEDEVCDEPCGQGANNLLMCTADGQTAVLSACMRNRMNSNFTPSRCECLEREIQTYAYDDCEICYATVTSVVADNQHPVAGCEAGKEIINITATIHGGCETAVNAVFGAKYDPKIFKALKDANDAIVSNHFTHEEPKTISGTVVWMELRGRNPDGSEKKETLTNDDEKTITFSLVFDPESDATINNYAVQVFIGIPDQTNAGYATIEPFFDINPEAGKTVLDVIPPTSVYRYFHLVNDLNIPELPDPAPAGNYITNKPSYRFDDYHFIIESGIKIGLETAAYVEMLHSSFEGCNTMWQGFELETRSGITLTNSTVEDAQKAVSAGDDDVVYARGSVFRNNNFGIFVEVPSGMPAPRVDLLGNTFETASTGLKPAFVGQFPAPASKGYTGVYLDRVPAANINTLTVNGNATPNTFQNLQNGILAQRSNLIVGQSSFADIQKEGLTAGYPLFSTGKGIYAKGGALVVRDAADENVSFDNCHTGIETTGTSSTTAWHTAMTNVARGIVTTGGLNNLQYNVIQAKNLGIGAYYQSGLGAGTQVWYNAITMDGDPDAIGIATGGTYIGIGGTDPSAQTEGNYSENSITMLDGAAAIQVIAADEISVARNTISLENSQNNRFGINLSGGDRNALGCNGITGPGGDNDGIRAVHPGRASVWCNTTDGTGKGLNIEGVWVGKIKADIAGNTMKNNGIGLLLVSDAVIGTQEHRGNIWEGTDAMAGNNAAQNSRFKVDATENPDYLPDTWLPVLWFEDVFDEHESFLCSTISKCISLDPSFTDSLDETIARGELPGEYYQSTNNWLAQRRLYERISEEGNPYPGNNDIAAFLTSAQSNGLAGYADIQTGIREAFAVGENDRNAFKSYEDQVTLGLDDLAELEAQLNTPGIGEQDSITLAAQWDSIFQAIQQATVSRESLLTGLTASLTAAGANLLTQNSSLPAPAGFEAHEKTVNDILLRTVAQGSFACSEQDSVALKSIAGLCPLSAGEAVLRARALLTLVEETPAMYDDDATCIQERSRPEAKAVSEYLAVYPNPASDLFVLRHNFTGDSGCRLLLFNPLGQLVKEISLIGQQDSQKIPVSDLKEGIYWYSIPGAGQNSSSGKIIIIH